MAMDFAEKAVKSMISRGSAGRSGQSREISIYFRIDQFVKPADLVSSVSAMVLLTTVCLMSDILQFYVLAF